MTQTETGDIVLHLHIQPKAAKSRIVGLYDGCLKVAVKAPPVEGKANQELIRFIAALLHIPSRDVSVKSGALAKRKQIAVRTTLSKSEIVQIIDAVLNQ